MIRPVPETISADIIYSGFVGTDATAAGLVIGRCNYGAPIGEGNLHPLYLFRQRFSMDNR
jgi:hypothetical protein